MINKVIIEPVFDSNEEMYMYWWLSELIAANYIISFDRAKTLDLSEKITRTTTVRTQLKTKLKVEEKDIIILEEHVYTPDYHIVWNPVAKNLFFLPLQGYKKATPLIVAQGNGDNYTSLVEIKPEFDAQNMTRLFQINKKWVFDKYGLFVTKVIPQELFEDTFTPVRYLFHNKAKGVRKINFKVRTLQEYIKDVSK